MWRSSCGFSNRGQGCLVAGGPQVGDHDPGPGDALVDVGKERVVGLGQDHRIGCGIGSGTQTDG